MNMTPEQLRALHASELQRLTTQQEPDVQKHAIMGVRSKCFDAVLADSPVALTGQGSDFDSQTKHFTKLWQRSDALVRAAGLLP